MGLPSPLRVAILGFGAVGAGTAWSLAEHGHRIVPAARVEMEGAEDAIAK